MLPSTRAFLAGIVDYAGLFPPARLPLPEAAGNFVQYQSSPHSWLLGRFVCPVGKLTDVLPLLRPEDTARVQFSALCPQRRGDEDFVDLVLTDVETIGQFCGRLGRDSAVDSLEVPLPNDFNVQGLNNSLSCLKNEMLAEGLLAFLEVPFQPSWRSRIDHLSRLLGELQAGSAIGLKLRCGGLTPEAFPTEEDVAHFILACRDAAIPWKATAGLHHPRRSWDPALKVWHHGFLNVFAAGMLALEHPLTLADVQEILTDREAKHLHFGEQGFAWKDWNCPTERIVERRKVCVSFGSCSFEEPCQDLLALGLI
jgi:hypothetical protein